MVDFPAATLWRKTRQGIVNGHRLTHAHFSKEEGMDGSVNGTDPQLYESFWWKAVFAEEAIAQITGGINISRIIHVAVGVDI